MGEIRSIRRLSPTILDLFYPSKCALCGELQPEPVCGACFSQFDSQENRLYRAPRPLDFGAALFDYTGLAARAVQRLKYERITSLARWMANLMRDGAEELGLLDVDAIVPVPIHWSREGLRGFNQAELLSESMPTALVCRYLLFRKRATRAQVGLTQAERAENIEGAFAVSQPLSLSRILLVDDVLTTGGTARECAATLKQAGALQVGILCFAAEARWRGN